MGKIPTSPELIRGHRFSSEDLRYPELNPWITSLASKGEKHSDQLEGSSVGESILVAGTICPMRVI